MFVAVLLAIGLSQKSIIFRRLDFTRGSYRPVTPSLEKQPLSKPLASYASALATAFPPSQRDRLKEVALALPLAQQKILGNLNFTQEKLERSLLRFEDDYSNADDSKYICSGFSIREIRALGDFPDYSTLSGVPMPKPYLDFNIDNAKARPYRPFRWPYHQTMCTSAKPNCLNYNPVTVLRRIT